MFAILENGSVETMLRYRLRFSTGRAFAIPTGQSKSPDGLANARPFLRTSIAGPTMSIIESFLVLGRLLARAKESAPSGGNGRRVISVDRPLRLRTAPRERPGCSPASLPPEGTSWPFSRCIGPDGPPVGGVQQLRSLAPADQPAHMASFCGLNCISAVGRPPVSTRWAFLVVLPVRSCGWVSCGPMQPMGAGEMAMGT